MLVELPKVRDPANAAIFFGYDKSGSTPFTGTTLCQNTKSTKMFKLTKKHSLLGAGDCIWLHMDGQGTLIELQMDLVMRKQTQLATEKVQIGVKNGNQVRLLISIEMLLLGNKGWN